MRVLLAIDGSTSSDKARQLGGSLSWPEDASGQSDRAHPTCRPLSGSGRLPVSGRPISKPDR